MTRQTIVATNETLKSIVEQEIEKYGLNADLNHIDTSIVTKMKYTFWRSKFNGDISMWDVSSVTVMMHMFAFSVFNGDIRNWVTSNVTDMFGMFRKSKFNQDISNWDVYSVTDMSCMFYGSRFNRNIKNWNTSNVKNMSCMFSESQFRSDISQWYTSNVTDKRWMFDDCPIPENHKPNFNKNKDKIYIPCKCGKIKYRENDNTRCRVCEFTNPKEFHCNGVSFTLDNVSDGSTAKYYMLPDGATELSDLIEHKEMNANRGEAFRALYRYGEAQHSSPLRDLKKAKYYIDREIKRLERSEYL